MFFLCLWFPSSFVSGKQFGEEYPGDLMLFQLSDRFLPELQACERALEAELVARCLISYARAALNLSPGTGDSNTVEGGATTSSGGDMDVDAPATDSCQMAFVIASETFSAEQAEVCTFSLVLTLIWNAVNTAPHMDVFFLDSLGFSPPLCVHPVHQNGT